MDEIFNNETVRGEGLQRVWYAFNRFHGTVQL